MRTALAASTVGLADEGEEVAHHAGTVDEEVLGVEDGDAATRPAAFTLWTSVVFPTPEAPATACLDDLAPRHIIDESINTRGVLAIHQLRSILLVFSPESQGLLRPDRPGGC